MSGIALCGGALVAGMCFRAPSDDEQKKRTWRFATRDLLLAFVVIAFAALVVGLVIREGVTLSWWRAAIAAASIALMAWLAQCVARGSWRWQALLALVLVVPVAALIDAAILNDWMVIDGLFLTHRYGATAGVIWFNVLPWHVALAVCLLPCATFTAIWRRDAAPVSRRMVLWRAASLLLAVPVLFRYAWIYWRMLVGPEAQAEQLAGENVYPRILEIATNLEFATPPQAADIYAQVMALASQPGHAVLDWHRPCREPVQRLVAYEQRKMNVLVWGLDSESARYRGLNRTDEAVPYVEAALRLRRMQARGGIVADSMAADASRGCLREVAAMRRSLSPATALRLSRVIETLEDERERPAAIVAREARFRFVNEGWRYRLMHAVWVDLYGYERVPDPYDRTVEPWSREFACLARMLSIDLALRAYRADRGEWPEKLEQLVPQYLNAIPLDPMSGESYVYRAAEPEFVLYSVGSDGRDDGGHFGNIMQFSNNKRTSAGLDVDADVLLRQ
jgi:hypothetical protein